MLRNSNRTNKVRPANYYTITAIRSRLYSVYNDLVRDGVEVLDLFAGVGKISLDSINPEHIKYIAWVDKDRRHLSTIRERIEKYNTKHKIIICDVLKFQFQKTFDIIFIDPPFTLQLIHKTLIHIFRQKFIDPEKGGLIIIKAYKQETIELSQFPEIINTHVTEQKKLDIYFIEVFQEIV